MSDTTHDLLDGCNGLLGLIQLISVRDDLTPELREVLETNYRIHDARAAVAKAAGADARIEELEGALRDILTGCNVMLQIPQSPAQRRFIEEVKRVASAPLKSRPATEVAA